MGRPKAMLDWHGIPLLTHMVGVLRDAGLDPVAISAAPDQELPPLPGEVLVLRDTAPFQGPLAGLASGLTGLIPLADRAVVVACDTPLLPKSLIDLLLQWPGRTVVSYAGGHAQPLLAVYATQLGPVARDLMAAGFNSPMQLLNAVHAVLLPERDFRAADPEMLSLQNCNTPESYARALAWRAAPKVAATGIF